MSAYLGQPLNTDEDFLIIKGFAIKRNVPLDPSKGLLLPPSLLSDPTQNRGPEISAGLGVILAVVVLATGARLLIRALHRGLKWGWDDWFILLGSAMVVSVCAVAIAAVRLGGGGKHLKDITYHEFYYFGQMGVVQGIMYRPTACVIKISILLFIRRISGLSSKGWRWINNVLLFAVTAYILGYTIWITTRCENTIKSLKTLATEKNPSKCNANPPVKLALGLASIHAALDVILLSTPIVLLWNVKIDLGRKIALFIIFALGSISTVGTVMIIVVSYEVQPDVTYHWPYFEVWILLDLFFAVLVANMPILFGQLPQTWKQFKAFTRSHLYTHSVSQRVHTLPEASAGTTQSRTGIYHREEDVESQSNQARSDGEDEFELLEARAVSKGVVMGPTSYEKSVL